LAEEVHGGRPDAADHLDKPVRMSEFVTRRAQFDIESNQGQAVAIGLEAKATYDF
jgi:hypothetical protein